MDSLGGACPYEVLGVVETATEGEIRKAYLKKALKWHPDKNRDKPDAEAMFHKIVAAYDFLSDADSKAAYDRVLKLKKAAKLRDLKLTAEQRKAKEDLERREEAFRKQRVSSVDAKRRLDAEIIRLRELGERRVQEESERLQRDADQAAGQAAAEAAEGADARTELKVKWKAKGSDEGNGGYSAETLHRLFSKYGPVKVVMGKKGGKAYVSFEAPEDAETALQLEQGIPSNPLHETTWATGDVVEPDGSGSAPFDAHIDDLEALEQDMIANVRRAVDELTKSQ